MSNPILDRGAQLAAALRQQPQFAALEPVEHVAIGSALQGCPELDRATVGAAWMLLGDVLGQLADTSGLTLQQAVAVAHLAGQRLYTETGREVHCTEIYSSGAPCKFGVKSLHESVLEATMRAHYATYHPDKTWPPVDEQAEADDDLCEGCRTRPAELIVGTVNKPDGQPGDAAALCFDCHRLATDTTWIQRAPNRPSAAPVDDAQEPVATVGPDLGGAFQP